MSKINSMMIQKSPHNNELELEEIKSRLKLFKSI